MKTRLVLWVGLTLGLVLVVGLGGKFFPLTPYRFQGSLIDPPIPAADFELTDHHGQVFKLSDQRGKVVVLFFGYTHCPDICPTTLTEYQKIHAGLKELANRVRFVFITVDPERDTPERLAEYIRYFDPDFIGLTGDRTTLETVWKSYGVYQQKQDVGSAAGYLVDHSTRLYVVNQQGDLILTYPFGFETEKIVEDLAFLVQNP